MKIKKLETADTGHEAICQAFLLTQIDSFAQLAATCDAYAATFPGHVLLVSLDELGQAQYTSMHAVMSHRLDDTEGHDLSGVDAAAFEDGVHLGYLSTPSEFFIRERNFLAKAGQVGFAGVCAKGLTLDDDELASMEQVHAEPELLLDNSVALWVVPVRDPALALCACPNGYFSCDLNPFENHALALHLQQYGYQLFGVGASCLGFRRASVLDGPGAQALGRDLARLYNCADDGEQLARLVKIVESHDYLFLKYVDYFEL